MQVCISAGVGLRLPALSRSVRTALEDVGDIDLIAAQAHGLDDLGQKLAGLATNGSPCWSSSAPGASPTNINGESILPTPKTTCFRELAKFGHLTHTSARARNSAMAAAFSVDGGVAGGGWLGTGFGTAAAIGAGRAGWAGGGIAATGRVRAAGARTGTGAANAARIAAWTGTKPHSARLQTFEC